MSNSFGASLFKKKIPVTCGDGKLRVAVDGDARQVVPDDLVYCKRKREKRMIRISGFLQNT